MSYLLVLVCIVCLVGCNKNDSKNVTNNTNTTGGENATEKQSKEKTGEKTEAKGRYVETLCGIPESCNSLSNLTIMEDGSLAILDTSSGSVFVSKDGGDSFTSSEVKAISKLLGREDIEFTSGTMNSKGEIFFSYILWNDVSPDADTCPEQYVYIDAEGNATNPKIKVSKSNSWLYRAQFSSNGKLYGLTNQSEIVCIDPVKETAEELFTGEEYIDIFTVSDTYIAVVDNKVGYLYDLESKQLNKMDDTFNSFFATSIKEDHSYQMAFDQNNKALYIACSLGIYRHVIDGNVMEQLVSGELTNLGSPVNTVYGFLAKDDGSFYVGYSNQELDHYQYDPNVAAVPEKQITIYSLYNNKTIQQAIVDYRKANPDVFVKLEIGMTGEDAVTKNDAIQKLNTSVLAGDGPDLLVLDGLPMDSYIEKGVLYDLSEEMKTMEQGGDYLTNITHAYESPNGVYGVPMKFDIPLLLGDKKKLESASSLTEFAAIIEEMRKKDTQAATILGCYLPQEIVDHLGYGCGSAWLNEEGKIEEDKLTEFLTCGKMIYDAEMEHLEEGSIEEHKEQMKTLEEMNDDRLWNLANIELQLHFLLYGDQKVAAGYMNNINTYQRILACLNVDSSLDFQKMDLQSENNFLANGIMGVNAATKDLETTMDFFRTLYSEKVQQAEVNDGFPVLKDAFLGLAKGKSVMEVYVGSSDNKGREISYELKRPTDEEMERLLGIAEQLTTPCVVDNTILETIEEFGEKAIKGDITIEEAVKNIVQKVNMYVQE